MEGKSSSTASLLPIVGTSFDQDRQATGVASEELSESTSFRRYAPDARYGAKPPRSRIDDLPKDAPLWLCVYLPRLPLEALGLADDAESVAVVEEVHSRVVLHAVSGAAVGQGLAPGLPLAAAYALSQGLRIEPRDPVREQRALESLAARGLAFTPWVSLDFPRALLLEVRGSLDLFGGLDALTAKLRASCSAEGHRVSVAVTPAPFASWLLARSGREQHASTREELRSVLGDLPSAVLGLDARTGERLGKAGIVNLRDLWRLPRDGLARRYGPRLLDVLDRAAGYREPPLRRFHLPPFFDETLELPEEAVRLADFFPAVELLIDRLVRFLTERAAAVGELVLHLVHRNAPPTGLCQGSRRPTRDGGHLARLLRERLERTCLTAPVCAVALSSAAVVPWTPLAADLFAELSHDLTEWQQLLDQVQARLGSGALRYFSTRSDHRPERAAQWTASPRDSAASEEPRPLWLLAEPRALSRWDLSSMLPGIERIESGWWDGAGMRRDYRRAVGRRGDKLWIYRDLRTSEQWYLHGLFG